MGVYPPVSPYPKTSDPETTKSVRQQLAGTESHVSRNQYEIGHLHKCNSCSPVKPYLCLSCLELRSRQGQQDKLHSLIILFSIRQTLQTFTSLAQIGSQQTENKAFLDLFWHLDLSTSVLLIFSVSDTGWQDIVADLGERWSSKHGTSCVKQSTASTGHLGVCYQISRSFFFIFAGIF